MKHNRIWLAKAAVVGLLAVVCLLPRVWGARYYQGGLGQLVHRKNSLYHSIFVYKRDSIVTLNFGRQPGVEVQSQVDLGNLRRHMLEYSTMTFCGLLYKPQPKSVLVVGLGGGVIPREMRHYYPDAEIDVVEIDPEVARIAKDYFDFKEDDKLRVNIDDGRMFLRKKIRDKSPRRYDVMVLDAFNSDYIPYHLMTREFLADANDLLADDGVVVANVFYPNRLFEAEFATFISVFGNCQAYFGTGSGNAMLVSRGSSGGLITSQEAQVRAQELQQKHLFDFDMPTVAGKLRPDVQPGPDAIVLTDDKAPVNRLRSQSR